MLMQWRDRGGVTMKNNNGIEPKTWKDFSKLKQEIETMLNKKIDNDYLMKLLIVQAKLIANGKMLEHKVDIPLEIDLGGEQKDEDSSST